jgi:hypothetical protein
MAVTVVLDHPRRHTGALLRRTFTEFAGGALVVLGLLATIAAIPTSLVVVGLIWVKLAGGDTETEPWPPEGLPVLPILGIWAGSTVVALVGLIGGLRMLRSERGVVLFLRRFGYDDATRIVTHAANETIGGSWRLVTLDDAEIQPIGVETGTRRLVQVTRFLWRAALAFFRIVGFRVFTTAILVLWAIVGIELLRMDNWQAFLDSGTPDRYADVFARLMSLDLPFDAIEISLLGAFAAVGIVATLSFLALMAMFAALLLALPFAGILLFASSSTDAVLAAERAKTRPVQTKAEVEYVAGLVEASRRKVFAPRLLVLRVSTGLWQQTVARLASIATVALIDVSEPTKNLLWELEVMNHQFGHRSILIGKQDRVDALVESLDQQHERGSLEHGLRLALDGHEILAYTTDRAGMRRFARALRGQLLTLAKDTTAPATEAVTTQVAGSTGAP